MPRRVGGEFPGGGLAVSAQGESWWENPGGLEVTIQEQQRELRGKKVGSSPGPPPLLHLYFKGYAFVPSRIFRTRSCILYTELRLSSSLASQPRGQRVHTEH